MADNVTTSAGTADGVTFAADNIAGVYFPRTKIAIGADGTNDGDVCSANPMPVTQASGVVHDAAASATADQIALEARNTEPTAVSATGDAVRAMGTMLGKQVVMPYAIPASTWSYAAATSGITNTSDVAAKAAAGAGIRNYVTGAQVVNAHATVGTEVVIKDGSTVIWRGYAAPVGGGVSAKFDPPLRGSANAAINVANITTGSATYFNLQGFVAGE